MTSLSLVQQFACALLSVKWEMEMHSPCSQTKTFKKEKEDQKGEGKMYLLKKKYEKGEKEEQTYSEEYCEFSESKDQALLAQRIALELENSIINSMNSMTQLS